MQQNNVDRNKIRLHQINTDPELAPFIKSKEDVQIEEMLNTPRRSNRPMEDWDKYNHQLKKGR